MQNIATKLGMQHIFINKLQFSQFRIGILPIWIETGRFETILDQQTGVLRKLNVNERTCNICNSGQTEDEFHFCFDALCMIGKGLTCMIDATELYKICIPRLITKNY